MYCQICGFKNNQGTNFCKRCGTILNPNALTNQTGQVPPIITIAFLFFITAITLVGFLIPLFAFSELYDKVNQSVLLFLGMIILGAVIGIDALLINLFTKYLGLTKTQLTLPPSQAPRPKYNTSEQELAQLPESPYATPSVTEHTTRNFEPIPETLDRQRS